VARVLGAKGLAGAVHIEPLTDWPERLEAGEAVYLEGEDEPRQILAAEWGSRVPALTLAGIGSREAAEALAGRYLERPRSALPAGSYYWHELEGLRVVDERGADIGRLVEIFRAGENEVYRVEGEAGELLIPALRDVVLSIDLAAGRMVVRYDAEEVR
jgi:16S rRNA processing protein RimM